MKYYYIKSGEWSLTKYGTWFIPGSANSLKTRYIANSRHQAKGKMKQLASKYARKMVTYKNIGLETEADVLADNIQTLAKAEIVEFEA